MNGVSVAGSANGHEDECSLKAIFALSMSTCILAAISVLTR
jgi:hypothetical protein